MQVKVGNTNINYEVMGAGYPIIMLPGWLAPLETLKPIAESLKDRFKIYLIDVIGMGKSELPEKPLNTDDFGNFLEELVKKLDIKKPPILIGHSNGGRIIINCVGRGLIEAKKIILIDSAGLKTKHSFMYYVKLYTYKLGNKILKILPQTEDVKELRQEMFDKRSSKDYKDSPQVLRETMKIILKEDQSDKLPNIKAPTLLIWGSEDTATPLYMAEKMEKLIPDSGLVTYEGAGHFSYLDNLTNCNIVIKEFLKEEDKK